MVGEKKIGQIKKEEVIIYENYRKFYTSSYNILSSINMEKILYEKLKEMGVEWIRIIEVHDNQTSNIHETKTFFFPLKFFEMFNICDDKVEHTNAGFTDNIGIAREVIEKFCIEVKK
jgi:uncharacterized UPF0160 family protein